MVHVYFGDGAGKTTAAMGLAIRAQGQGWRVAVAQFFKDNTGGERRVLGSLPHVTLLPAPDTLPFPFAMTAEEKQEYQSFMNGMWERILTLLTEKQIDLLVLDEWGDAVAQGWFTQEQAAALWDGLGDTEVVITTHTLPHWLRERADYLTEMTSHRHPYKKGTPARKGIEY